VSIYGEDFAQVYNATWFNFSAWLWPFISEVVRRQAPHAHTWLDLCCGTGHLLKIVLDEGFCVTGLDRSPHMLQYARENAPAARLVEADVRSYRLGKRFDVVTCLFGSLNYLTRKRDLGQALCNAQRHLAEDGLFVFEINTFEGLKDSWDRTSVRHDEACVIITETSFNAKRSLGVCRITGFVQEGCLYRKFEEEHLQRGWRPDEADGLLTEAGFSIRKYDGRKLARPRKRSDRLVYVCRPVR